MPDSPKELVITCSCRRRSRNLDDQEMNTICSSVDAEEYSKSKKRNSCDPQSPPASEFESKNRTDGTYKGKKGVNRVGIIMTSGGGGDQRNDDGFDSSTCVSHGSISVIGRRRAMEDAVMVAPGVAVIEFDHVYDFFAVYDGHGGARVSNACRDRLHLLVAKEVEENDTTETAFGDRKGLSYWEKVMGVCFKKMDDEVTCGGLRDADEEGYLLSEKTVGSTAVVVLVGKEELVVANCGDSRAVLCRGGVAVALSTDHKPDRHDERRRVEAAGGRVLNWNGSRVLGVLGTSRSIGDQYLKPYVSSEPEVTVVQRMESDDFLVIGSDGLWDVISNEFACEVVKKCFGGQIKHRTFLDDFNGSWAAEAAALLAELAMAKGSRDNISVIVVELKNTPK
ncbi:protein phosphatase 2C 51-like [Mercurialis annua]|uniref:protein phosphatase 2C 51-like n=1 Tax=Mercurialis annua TaxID=3986 RepID=UPI00215E0BCD|nr:protein phosphatase 2C 51-like [Mercurialis annua]